MANVFFDTPPTLSGDEAGQLQQMYSYLYQMSEKLNTALMDISVEQLAPQERQVMLKLESEETDVATAKETLKSLIIKTAEIVRHEMTEISTTLTDRYEAISSEFGEYSRNLEATITATARGIMQEYNYDETIRGLQQTDAGLLEFETRTNQYIFSGIIDPTTGEAGIAIGENVTNADGSLNSNNKMATFTKNRLSFFQGGREVAYYSDNAFYIKQGIIEHSLQMGSHVWRILDNGAIALMKA